MVILEIVCYGLCHIVFLISPIPFIAAGWYLVIYKPYDSSSTGKDFRSDSCRCKKGSSGHQHRRNFANNRRYNLCNRHGLLQTEFLQCSCWHRVPSSGANLPGSSRPACWQVSTDLWFCNLWVVLLKILWKWTFACGRTKRLIAWTHRERALHHSLRGRIAISALLWESFLILIQDFPALILPSHREGFQIRWQWYILRSSTELSSYLLCQ